MTGSPELLEFYLVEATEYLDALDQLVAGTGAPPDGNAFIATARALRGASSMAKVAPIESIAMTMEQLAHGLRDGDLRWTLDLYRALRDTVDDLRFLVRGVRTWGEREGARADARIADLNRFLGSEAPRQATPAPAATAPVFIALQSSAIAAELDAFVNNPRHRRALDDALTRARTMRGIAGIGDYPPLADVADAVDRTARALMPDAPLATTEVELFRAASDVLRQMSSRLREGLASDPQAPEVARFAHAVAALAEPGRDAPPVVAIEELFYADEGPHIIQRAVAPPVTRAQRFRDEMVPRVEHVRRLVSDARLVRDVAGQERVSRALHGALLELQTVAASFDVHQVAAFFGEIAREQPLLATAPLDALEAGSLLLLAPGESVDEVERRLAVLERSRRSTPIVTSRAVTPSTNAPAQLPVAVPTESAPPVAPVAGRAPLSPAGAPPQRRAAATPTGRALQDLLQEGIAGFQTLDDEPLSEPARLDEDEIVPIESLLYRGPSAIQRAIEVRDAMRERGRIDDANLQEIFDLLDLAQAE